MLCQEHIQEKEKTKHLSSEPPPVCYSGSVNLQMQHLRDTAEYWKRESQYWQREAEKYRTALRSRQGGTTE